MYIFIESILLSAEFQRDDIEIIAIILTLSFYLSLGLVGAVAFISLLS
jgi:hypothetical protein